MQAERVGWKDVGGFALHMVAVLANCRKALVGTVWAISLYFCTNKCTKPSSRLVEALFLAL